MFEKFDGDALVATNRIFSPLLFSKMDIIVLKIMITRNLHGFEIQLKFLQIIM